MSTTYDSAEQQIINWLVSIFEDDTELNDINWYNIPANAYETFNVPFGHVYTITTTEKMQAAPDLYEYTSTILVVIADKIITSNGAERKVLYFQEKIRDLIIQNMQPVDTGSTIVIPDLCTVIRSTIRRSAYLSDPPDPDDTAPMDWLQIELDIEYTRVVT